jgi:hypothetical protein
MFLSNYLQALLFKIKQHDQLQEGSVIIVLSNKSDNSHS